MTRIGMLTLAPRRLAEETANQWTHGFGCVLSVIGAVVMLGAASAGNTMQLVGCAVYATSLVALYAASTLSHSFADPRRREFFRMLDQVCIFLLAVGSFTPFALLHLTGGAWWTLLVAMWVLALVGMFFRVRDMAKTIAIGFFLPVSWIPALAIARIAEVGQSGGLILVLAGALFYTIGLVFLINDTRVRYFHALWHLFTIAGSACHYFFLLHAVALWPT